jgi:hypothetical protein
VKSEGERGKRRAVQKEGEGGRVQQCACTRERERERDRDRDIDISRGVEVKYGTLYSMLELDVLKSLHLELFMKHRDQAEYITRLETG